MDNGHNLKLNAAELDAALERAENALPRDGSGTMTGALILAGRQAQSVYGVDGKYAYINAYENDDWAQRRTLTLHTRQNNPDIKTAFVLSALDDGTWRDYHILHTGSKPSSSYTGNGSATSRTINVGGIGNVVLVWCEAASTAFLVTPVGAFGLKGSAGVGYLNYQDAHFVDGVLTVATTDAVLNGSGNTYRYQVM